MQQIWPLPEVMDIPEREREIKCYRVGLGSRRYNSQDFRTSVEQWRASFNETLITPSNNPYTGSDQLKQPNTGSDLLYHPTHMQLTKTQAIHRKRPTLSSNTYAVAQTTSHTQVMAYPNSHVITYIVAGLPYSIFQILVHFFSLFPYIWDTEMSIYDGSLFDDGL